MKSPTIVPVPEKMQKYYGTGTMLHPEIEMIAAAITVIPKGKIVRIDNLAKKLAKDYGSDVTCPMRTGNHLKRISKKCTPDNYQTSPPFWRVIRSDGMLVKLDNYEFWATVLEKEGFVLEHTKSNKIKLVFQENQVFDFFD